jgi:hypothetical protein
MINNQINWILTGFLWFMSSITVVEQRIRRLLFHMFCYSFAVGFSSHAFLKSTFTGFGGDGLVQAVGAVFRTLVNPQRCTNSCFDVCLIYVLLSGHGTPTIIWCTRGGCSPYNRWHTYSFCDVCLGGVIVRWIVWERELVYTCARKILVSIQCFSLCLFLLSQKLDLSMDCSITHGLFQVCQHEYLWRWDSKSFDIIFGGIRDR